MTFSLTVAGCVNLNELLIMVKDDLSSCPLSFYYGTIRFKILKLSFPCGKDHHYETIGFKWFTLPHKSFQNTYNSYSFSFPRLFLLNNMQLPFPLAADDDNTGTGVSSACNLLGGRHVATQRFDQWAE